MTLKKDAKIDDARKWLRDETQLGRVSRERARLARTALGKFADVRLDTDPDSIEWLSQNVDVLAQRMVGLSEVSVRSYSSRMRSLLEEYQRYLQDAEGFRVMRKTVLRPHEDVRCQLSNGREFVYRIPEGGVTSSDIQRIAAHLWALASDFDPMRTPWGGEG